MRLRILLSLKPESGDIIKGSNGLRKLRFSIGDKGKSGGLRVIYYYYNASIPLFLIDIYAKNRKEDLSQAELKQLAKFADILKQSRGKK